MTSYLLIETRSLWESQEVAGFLALARELAAAGNRVDVYLIQNAVLITRDADAIAALTGLPQLNVWADTSSLSTRAIPAATLPPRIEVADMNTIVRLMTRPGSKTIWH
jgi:sulfur transfer complex TusBCD TusB component (DsrH family)